MLKMTISTSVWRAQHPNAGWNIQQQRYEPMCIKVSVQPLSYRAFWLHFAIHFSGIMIPCHLQNLKSFWGENMRVLKIIKFKFSTWVRQKRKKEVQKWLSSFQHSHLWNFHLSVWLPHYTVGRSREFRAKT